jgi:uncharacterized protein YbjT (DUF2867 family)
MHDLSGDKKGFGRFCDDLPTSFDGSVGKILVTGAFGYIGGRLVPELLARGYDVRVMVRAPLPEGAVPWPGVDVVVADALDAASLVSALDGIDVAYYLIHSMLLGPKEFVRADAAAAANFREAARKAGVGRIIYLGGLGDVRSNLSDHLKSRMEVARELRSGPVDVTILRAAIIIGSGSASYEIIKNLVIKLPVIFVPNWTRNLCQPVSIRDVIKYLVGVLETGETSGRTFDIGGREVLSYQQMMRTVAGVLGRRRLFVMLPLASIRAFAYLASLLTPVPGPITLCLMEGLRNDVICQDREIERYLPFEPVGFRESIVRALTREEQDNIHTRWSDAYPPAHMLAIKLHEIEGRPRYTSSCSIETSKTASSLFASICRIGGREGWFHNNWMWRLRGGFDRIIMGVGSRRGRRQSGALAVNDVIDFWRVEDIRENRRLLLRAEMKLPGRAWLEFVIEDTGDRRLLALTAHYQTSSLAGRLYWYVFMPFHSIIFRGLIRQIEERSR